MDWWLLGEIIMRVSAVALFFSTIILFIIGLIVMATARRGNGSDAASPWVIAGFATGFILVLIIKIEEYVEKKMERRREAREMYNVNAESIVPSYEQPIQNVNLRRNQPHQNPTSEYNTDIVRRHAWEGVV